MAWKKIEEVKFIVVHCSATQPKQDIGVKEIREWHQHRGFFDVGYQKVIRRDGTEEDGRPLDVPGAHARGFNHISIGICLVGGVTADGRTPRNNFTKHQFETLKRLLLELKRKHPQARILGHRDLPRVAKECPCFDVAEWCEKEDIPHEPGSDPAEAPSSCWFDKWR